MGSQPLIHQVFTNDKHTTNEFMKYPLSNHYAVIATLNILRKGIEIEAKSWYEMCFDKSSEETFKMLLTIGKTFICLKVWSRSVIHLP